MKLVVLSGTAHVHLAEATARALGVTLGERVLERFPDGEIQLDLRADVRDADVFLVQPTGQPVGENLLELALLADACRRMDAGRITAVVPYLGYARHDRREHEGEPLGGRVVANMISASVDRVLAVDLHTGTLEGCFSVPLDHVTAVPLLIAALRPHAGRGAVVVAPDHGAAKLADVVARALDLPTALVHKTRLSGSEVAARSVVGDVRGRAPILVDDMIATGGTIAAAAGALLVQGCAPHITVAATHGLFVGPALERLRDLPLEHVVVTDSLPQWELPRGCEVVSVASLLAEAIRRRHKARSLTGLLVSR